jgi:dolichol-phosphate mannosyltransferase
MTNRKSLLILVCSYNEGDNLPELMSRITAIAPDADILLVDDGSTDSTYRWLADHQSEYPQLTVKNRGGKRGLGTAIRDGLQYAIDNDYQFCLNLDADLSHDPREIPVLLAAMNEDVDLAIGSRYVAGGGLQNCSWRRKLVSRTVNFLARTIISWKFRDCSSAYRCYRVAKVAEMNIQSIDNASYGFLEEILWRMWKSGAKIVERPIVYLERELGESKISMREATQTFGTLLRLHRFKSYRND